MLEKIKEPRKRICDHQNGQERPLKIVKMSEIVIQNIIFQGYLSTFRAEK